MAVDFDQIVSCHFTVIAERAKEHVLVRLICQIDIFSFGCFKIRSRQDRGKILRHEHQLIACSFFLHRAQGIRKAEGDGTYRISTCCRSFFCGDFFCRFLTAVQGSQQGKKVT